jgi:hypothetical protein
MPTIYNIGNTCELWNPNLYPTHSTDSGVYIGKRGSGNYYVLYNVDSISLRNYINGYGSAVGSRTSYETSLFGTTLGMVVLPIKLTISGGSALPFPIPDGSSNIPVSFIVQRWNNPFIIDSSELRANIKNANGACAMSDPKKFAYRFMFTDSTETTSNIAALNYKVPGDMTSYTANDKGEVTNAGLCMNYNQTQTAEGTVLLSNYVTLIENNKSSDTTYDDLSQIEFVDRDIFQIGLSVPPTTSRYKVPAIDDTGKMSDFDTVNVTATKVERNHFFQRVKLTSDSVVNIEVKYLPIDEYKDVSFYLTTTAPDSTPANGLGRPEFLWAPNSRPANTFYTIADPAYSYYGGGAGAGAPAAGPGICDIDGSGISIYGKTYTFSLAPFADDKTYPTAEVRFIDSTNYEITYINSANVKNRPIKYSITAAVVTNSGGNRGLDIGSSPQNDINITVSGTNLTLVFTDPNPPGGAGSQNQTYSVTTSDYNTGKYCGPFVTDNIPADQGQGMLFVITRETSAQSYIKPIVGAANLSFSISYKTTPTVAIPGLNLIVTNIGFYVQLANRTQTLLEYPNDGSSTVDSTIKFYPTKSLYSKIGANPSQTLLTLAKYVNYRDANSNMLKIIPPAGPSNNNAQASLAGFMGSNGMAMDGTGYNLFYSFNPTQIFPSPSSSPAETSSSFLWVYQTIKSVGSRQLLIYLDTTNGTSVNFVDITYTGLATWINEKLLTPTTGPSPGNPFSSADNPAIIDVTLSEFNTIYGYTWKLDGVSGTNSFNIKTLGINFNPNNLVYHYLNFDDSPARNPNKQVNTALSAATNTSWKCYFLTCSDGTTSCGLAPPPTPGAPELTLGTYTFTNNEYNYQIILEEVPSHGVKQIRVINQNTNSNSTYYIIDNRNGTFDLIGRPVDLATPPPQEGSRVTSNGGTYTRDSMTLDIEDFGIRLEVN